MYFNLQHSLHTYLETVFGKFLRNITRALRLGNPSDMSLLLRIICGRLRLTTFLKFRHRRFIFPSILNQSTSVPKLGKESGNTSLEILPTVQYFLPGFNLNTLNACGTTILFCLSYGGGIPSNTFNRSRAASPRFVLRGIIPRTAL
jgi:hypothetical protein